MREPPDGTVDLRTPIPEDAARSLSAGDLVSITGRIFTIRDQGHLRALSGSLPVDLAGMAIYHCGPLVRETSDGWDVLAAGPTTSIRMEEQEPEFLRRTGVRAVIGKGGMGPATGKALAETGAVYLAWTGGAAVLASDAIDRVVEVNWLDLGLPEALWTFDVTGFGPLVVAMDAHGNDLYRDVMSDVERGLPEIRSRLGI